MNKADFVAAVAERTELSKAAAERIIGSMFDIIAEELRGGGEVRVLPDFGIFHAVARSGGEGRNPRTGETITVPAKNSARFKLSSSLKRRLNQPKRKVGSHRNQPLRDDVSAP
jgi:DNA-binding protein HU-beta